MPVLVWNRLPEIIREVEVLYQDATDATDRNLYALAFRKLRDAEGASYEISGLNAWRDFVAAMLTLDLAPASWLQLDSIIGETRCRRILTRWREVQSCTAPLKVGVLRDAATRYQLEDFMDWAKRAMELGGGFSIR